MDAAVRELSYAQAIQEAMAIAMDMDDRVFLMGEDIGVYGGAFQVTGDLVERYGTERVIDTPISELGGAGVAVGAAVTGMRPILRWARHIRWPLLAPHQPRGRSVQTLLPSRN